MVWRSNYEVMLRRGYSAKHKIIRIVMSRFQGSSAIVFCFIIVMPTLCVLQRSQKYSAHIINHLLSISSTCNTACY